MQNQPLMSTTADALSQPQLQSQSQRHQEQQRQEQDHQNEPASIGQSEPTESFLTFSSSSLPSDPSPHQFPLNVAGVFDTTSQQAGGEQFVYQRSAQRERVPAARRPGFTLGRGAVSGPLTSSVPTNESRGPELRQSVAERTKQQETRTAGSQQATSISPATLVQETNDPLRVMHADFVILSAEQDDDGHPTKTRRNCAAAVPAKAKGVASAAGDGLGTRKRTRVTQVEVFAGPEEQNIDDPNELDEKKRARGRPRLNSTDQTPQERRRTQIRLAQRAYRNRKESAISDLQKEVDGLKAVNDQMSQAYQDLVDTATRNGLLEQAPEFGQQLLKLQSLAKQARASSKDSDGTGEGDSDSIGHQTAKGHSEESSSNRYIETSMKPAPQQQPQNPQEQQQQQQQKQKEEKLYAGIMVSQEPVPEPLSHHYPPTLPDLCATQHDAPISYEVIAQPTSQNASFPPSLSFDQSFIVNSWTPSPWNSLPTVNSFAYSELTFGRRLQRTALQRVATLLLMEHPPPDKMMRIFGFARLFETFEQIKERTFAALEQTRTETLHNWKFPFHNLGGAGTHFPMLGSRTSDPKNNQLPNSKCGNFSGIHPKVSNGFAMGPFDTKVGRIRDSLIVMGQHIQLPGWDGAFWDPDEVEEYLKQNGVFIPPMAEHHVVELDDGAFGVGTPLAANVAVSPHMRATGSSTGSIPSAVGSSSSDGSTDNITIHSSFPEEGWPNSSSMSVRGGPGSAMPKSGNYFFRAFTQGVSGPGPDAFDPSGMSASFADPSLLGFNTGCDGFGTPPPRPARKVVRIDVERLIDRK